MPKILDSLCEACVNAVYVGEVAAGNFIQCAKDADVKEELEKGATCEDFEIEPES